ncbi:hypothetical protein [Pseudarthrobacter sp. lyk4-40-TYG-27]|uniref:hypothetical protein n=1 Tax=Pseudarthrobacter sp. lyk4-40-TYG-27 TaxID=3040305 RepID=UPI00255317F7|nr:hypothetical protein [Pseudarthrobacter sp. lyk4-40-TYG-27]
MRRLKSIPGATLAVGAFVFTVLLGVGGGSASALWQQSATASMAVTASGTWPANKFSGFTCTNDNPRQTAVLSAVGSTTPTALSYAALQSNGTYGPAYTESVSLGTTSTVTLTIASQIVVANRTTTPLTIRVTATYADQSQTTASATVSLEQGNNSNKVTCLSTTF